MGDTNATPPAEPQAPKTTPQAPAAPETPATPATPPAEPEKAKGDDAAALSRIQAERDALKAQLAQAEGKLKDAKTLEDVETAKEAIKAEIQADADRRLLDANVDLALVKAGCVNTKATKALIDMSALKAEGDAIEGLDTAKLAKDYPYLFQTAQTVSTGAAPASAAAAGVVNSISEGVDVTYPKGFGT